jgi:multiubiquitin
MSDTAAVQDDEKKEKTVTIVVDGTPYEVPKKEEITYEEVVALVYPDFAQHPEITYSVTFTKGHGGKEGILPPGGRVTVKEGMAFRVNRTGQS